MLGVPVSNGATHGNTVARGFPKPTRLDFHLMLCEVNSLVARCSLEVCDLAKITTIQGDSPQERRGHRQVRRLGRRCRHQRDADIVCNQDRDRRAP
jgi:hypothetical protein